MYSLYYKDIHVCISVFFTYYIIIMYYYIYIVSLDSYSIVIAFTNIFVRLNATEQRVS